MREHMADLNLLAGWTGIFLGFVAGAIQGLFFHKEDWLGGYGSWPRRMTRLGHISFFGIAFVNLAFAFSVSHLGPRQISPLISPLLIAGAVGMPLVCYLSAFIKPVRHLFFIPVVCLLGGAIMFILEIV
jgi:hypothetical protein